MIDIKKIRSKKWVSVISGIILIGSLALQHFITLKKAAPMSTPSPTVTLGRLHELIVPETVTSYGTTVSPDIAGIAAQTAGIITAIYFNPGDHVKKGQLLFEIKSSDTSNQTQELKAQMLASKDAYDRLRQLNQHYPGAIALANLTDARLKYEENLAAYQEAQTIAQVTAPAEGVLSDTNFSVGSSVTDNTVLAHIITPNQLQIKYALPQEAAGKIHVGQTVYFYPNDGHSAYTGTVSYISPTFNANDLTLTLRANLTHSETLKPYLFGKVIQVTNPTHQVLVIPQIFVQTDALGFYIDTIKNNRVIKHYFTPGDISPQGMISVQSGITKNTPIITSDSSDLNPGEIVRVTTS